MLSTWVNQYRGNQVSGLDFILLQAGQSNAVGWGTGPTSGISYSLDPQATNLKELTLGYGTNLVANSDFSSGLTTGWVASSGATLSVASGAMVVTKTGAGSNVATYTATGLTIGLEYEVWMKFVATNMSAGQQIVITTAGSGSSVRTLVNQTVSNRYLKKRFTATTTSQTIALLFASTAEANGTFFSVTEINCRVAQTSGMFERIAIEPMEWPDWANTASYNTSPGFHFSRELLRQGASSVKVIAAAVGGTALYGSVWAAPAGVRYQYALAQLTLAVAANPSAQVVMNWIQGEADGLAGVSAANYKQAFKDMVAGFRAVAPNMKIIIGSMVPEYIAANPGVSVIDVAEKALPTEMTQTQFATMISGFQIVGDLPHYTVPGDRLIGKRMGETFGGLSLSTS